MGPAPAAGQEDYDLINAGKQPVTLLPGGAFFHHADSFAMMRGGHLDICVLGAFQVSATGDLANWSTGEPGAIPAVGGAMDLAIGAKQTWVMMDTADQAGRQQDRAQCTYPLTGIGCVKRIYTDLAVTVLYGRRTDRAGPMACVLDVASSSVNPSAGALATMSAPRLPPAPGLLSTTTLAPSASLRRVCSARANRSVAPPAGNGTTRRTVRPGVCATAGPHAAVRAADKARVRMN
jgi:hypothetical protein